MIAPTVEPHEAVLRNRSLVREVQRRAVRSEDFGLVIWYRRGPGRPTGGLGISMRYCCRSNCEESGMDTVTLVPVQHQELIGGDGRKRPARGGSLTGGIRVAMVYHLS